MFSLHHEREGGPIGFLRIACRAGLHTGMARLFTLECSCCEHTTPSSLFCLDLLHLLENVHAPLRIGPVGLPSELSTLLDTSRHSKCPDLRLPHVSGRILSCLCLNLSWYCERLRVVEIHRTSIV